MNEVGFRIEGVKKINGDNFFDELCKAYADGRKVWMSFGVNGKILESNLLTSEQLLEVIEKTKGLGANV